MPPSALFEMSQVNFDQVVADQEEIRRYNPQRFEMEQLDGHRPPRPRAST